MESKVCNRCGQIRARDQFTPDNRNKDGLQGICTLCKKSEKQAARAKRIAQGSLILVAEKTCNKCSKTKEAEAFYKDSGIADGLATICKECKDKSMATWREENRSQYNANMRKLRAENKEWAKAVDLKRCYGLSLETYKQMLLDQGGMCAICRGLPKGKRPLCVDHCHNSGKVRGLLCYGCNRLMVLLDNEELFAKALVYKKAA